MTTDPYVENFKLGDVLSEEGAGWKIVYCMCEGRLKFGNVLTRSRKLGCLCPEHGLPSLGDGEVDHCVTDPPFGERTHAGQRHERATGYPRRDRAGNITHRLSDEGDLGYDHLTPEQVALLATELHRTTKFWTLCMTSHDLYPAYEQSFGDCGRYVFAPIPIVIPGMNIRLAGDGPSNWTIWLVVARPKIARKWGTKRGAYTGIAEIERVDRPVKGAKSRELMEAILGDYTERGELVCDPFAGSGSTGAACIRMGRRFLGYEINPANFEVAVDRLRRAREQIAFCEEVRVNDVEQPRIPVIAEFLDEEKEKQAADKRAAKEAEREGEYAILEAVVLSIVERYDGYLSQSVLGEVVDCSASDLRTVLRRLVERGMLVKEGSAAYMIPVTQADEREEATA